MKAASEKKVLWPRKGVVFALAFAQTIWVISVVIMGSRELKHGLLGLRSAP